MTGSLVREQLRAQRGALITAASLIAVTVALTTFALLTAVTQRDVSNGGYDNAAGIELVKRAPSDGYGQATQEELDALVATAVADGDTVVVSQGYTVWSRAEGAAPDDEPHLADVSLLTGTPVWDSIVLDGSAPQQGQLVISSRLATLLGIGIGDAMVVSENVDGAAGTLEFTVSGISRGQSNGPIIADASSAYGNWADADALTALTPTTDAWAWLRWDSPSDTLDHYTDFLIVDDWDVMRYAQPTAVIALIAALAIAVATVAAAFGLGRAQAQARTQWVATARALGATRATVTRAALVEWGVLTAAGGVGGVVLGYVAMVGMLAWQRTADAQPALPMLPTVPAGALVAMMGLAALLAGIIALIPALWARQVEPAEALKDSSPVTERTAPHTVPTWALLLGLAVAAAVHWQLQFAYYAAPHDSWAHALSSWVWYLMPLVAGLLTLALLARGLRASLRATGRRLAASASPVRATAGDVLATRASAVAGLVVAPWGAASVAMLLLSNPQGFESTSPTSMATPALVLAGTFAVMAGVAHVAARASLGAGRAEWTARRALGLSAADAKRALGGVHAVSLGLGVAMGAVAAAVVTWAATALSGAGPGGRGFVDAVWPVLVLAAPVVVLGAVLFAVTAGSLVGAPVRERVPAGGGS